MRLIRYPPARLSLHRSTHSEGVTRENQALQPVGMIGAVAASAPYVRFPPEAAFSAAAAFHPFLPFGGERQTVTELTRVDYFNEAERLMDMGAVKTIWIALSSRQQNPLRRIAKCRELAKYINDPRTTETLLQMADEVKGTGDNETEGAMPTSMVDGCASHGSGDTIN